MPGDNPSINGGLLAGTRRCCLDRHEFKQFMALKTERYGINFKSINSVEIPYTHSMVVAAGRPENEEGPHYTKDVLSTVQRLVTNLKKHVKLMHSEELLKT